MNESDLRSDVHYLGSSENKAQDVKLIAQIGASVYVIHWGVF